VGLDGEPFDYVGFAGWLVAHVPAVFLGAEPFFCVCGAEWGFSGVHVSASVEDEFCGFSGAFFVVAEFVVTGHPVALDHFRGLYFRLCLYVQLSFASFTSTISHAIVFSEQLSWGHQAYPSTACTSHS
jgi:hypothetical protein